MKEPEKKRGLLDVLPAVVALLTLFGWLLRPLRSLLPRRRESHTIVPTPPPSSPANDPESPERRRLLIAITAGVGGVASAAVGVPIVTFVLSPLLRKEPKVWRQVGAVDQFRPGETVEVKIEDPSPLPWAGVTADSAVYLRRTGDQTFEAYSIHCTHLGCPVRWLADANLFMCPCHGGVYYADGAVACGPPPRPLVKFPVRIEQGQVEVQPIGLPITKGKTGA